MRFADGNVKLRRLKIGITRRVFDDETFSFRFLTSDLRLPISRASRKHLQSEIPPDAVLQMHDEIALLQVREINIQRGARGLRVRGLLPTRSLHFVSAKNLRVRNDYKFCLVANEPASERANLSRRSRVEGRGLGRVRLSPLASRLSPSPHLSPHFLKPLTLAVVVAENLDNVALAQPTMQLVEKLPPLRLGNLYLWCAFTQWTERVE